MVANQPHERSGLRIVVLENGVGATGPVADLLRVDGHRVHTTSDGSSALRAAQAEAPDVMLLDTDVSGVDGCEIAEEVRRLPLLRRPLVIAVTGPEQKTDRSRSLDAGIHLHLLKPINKEFLSRVLRRFESVIMADDLAIETPEAALVCN